MLFFKADDDLHNLREVNPEGRPDNKYLFTHQKTGLSNNAYIQYLFTRSS